MTSPIALSRDVARRFMVLRHLLAPPRSLPAGPAGVMRVFERIGSLQFDPLDIAGRNHDLVLLARVADYRRAITDRLLYEDRVLYETYNKGLSIVPTAELPFYRVTWDRQAAHHAGGTFDEHAPLVEELLARIRTEGPLAATDIEPRAAIDWYWRPTNPIRAILEALAESGVLGLSRRDGNRRVYDLAERLFPPELLAERHPPGDQLRHKLLSRYRAHGLLGTGGQAELWPGLGPASERPALRARLLDDGELVPVELEGFRSPRYLLGGELPIVDAAAAELAAGVGPGSGAPGVAFLAPLDPFVWDRDFLRRLFDFDYLWEVYVPAAKRRWGYYVLPILFGDRLVGRIEPRIERRTGRLTILGMWFEPGFDPMADPGFVDAFADALLAHMAFGEVTKVAFPRVARVRPFVAAVRAALGRRAASRSEDPALVRC